MSRADSRAPSAAFARRVVGAPLTDALPSQQNPRRPPGTRLQWRTGEAPCGAVVLQCAAARSLAQMSRDSKEKMRALRGERLEKRKIKSRARRPPPVYARRRSAAVGFWTRRCGGTEGRARQRRCRLCCVRDILYGIWQTACELALFCRQNST